jgi:DNA-binding NarL/FixJ family response regulator
VNAESSALDSHGIFVGMSEHSAQAGATTKHPSITLVVIDDSKVFLKGICDFLANHSWIQVVATADNESDAATLVGATKPDLVLLDLHLRSFNGLNLLPVIREKSPNTRVIIVTSDDGSALRQACLDAGAHEFLNKQRIVSDLFATIAQCMP